MTPDTAAFAHRNLPRLLLQAREAVMAHTRPALRAHALSDQQWRVLRVLDESGPTAPTQLAAECVILMPSLTRHAKPRLTVHGAAIADKLRAGKEIRMH